jgi:hypothetical protein
MNTMPYKTRMDENDVLDYFWLMTRDAEVDRIALLKQIAGVALSRPSGWDEWQIRQEMGSVTRNRFHEKGRIRLESERCFCCLTEDRRVYWHHIIQVQHGGSNTPRNLVTLCHRCHRSVHPWLPAPNTLEQRGFVWLRDLAGRALDKLTAMWKARQEAWEASRPSDDQPF